MKITITDYEYEVLCDTMVPVIGCPIAANDLETLYLNLSDGERVENAYLIENLPTRGKGAEYKDAVETLASKLQRALEGVGNDGDGKSIGAVLRGSEGGQARSLNLTPERRLPGKPRSWSRRGSMIKVTVSPCRM